MKSKLSFLARSVIIVFMLLAGTVSGWAATETTVYYAIPSATVGSYTVKLSVNRKGDGDDWAKYDMTATGKFYNGNPVYECTFTDLYNGLGKMQFQLYDGSTWKSQEEPISTWTPVETYNGKLKEYGKTGWVEPQTTYKVTYDGNGHDSGNVPDPTFSDESGRVTIAGQGTLGRTGYSFVNWTTNPDGSGNSYSPEATPTINSNLTLYAQWEEVMHTVTVSAGDHGNVNIPSTSVGISTNATIIATPDDGYRFVSWTKNGNVTIANVNDATTTITATGDGATVTANFEKIPDYVDITVAVRTTGAAKGYWNTDEAATAYFWVSGGEFPGEVVTSKLTYDGHKYFYKTYTVPYGNALKIRVHNQAEPSPSKFDTRSEEICIENVTTDKTYYYSLGAWKETNPGLSYSIFTTEDDSGYYLVVNNTRHAGAPGKDIVKYKFQPVLIREMANPELSETLYTLTLPDFVLTGAQKRAENPNCFDSSGKMYYTIQKGDGSVIYQPKSSTGNYKLGYGSGNVKETSNGNLTNVQMESYNNIENNDRAFADTEGFNFFLEKSTLAKSYTWYLNIGTTPYYPPADRGKRFDSNAHSVTIAANQLVEGHTKNAIVEQNNASGVQDYYLTGNLKFGGDNTEWHPVNDKMKMTRMFFKGGKSYVAGSTPDVTKENCDSIVYVLQMVRPKDGWGNMFLSMVGERNLDAYNSITNSNLVAWWATLIRPQVFTNMDAQWNFGGLEVNGSLNDGTYTTSYGNTSQAINPILDETVTGYTAYFNMTNATYRLEYYKVSESEDEGLFIIGPAVSIENFDEESESENDDSYHASKGRKVKLVFNSETGAYEAIGIKLTKEQNFRFANIKKTTTIKTEGGYETSSEMKSAYESYYDEDKIVPARDGEPGDADWIAAQTWETDYFNRLSKLKNADDVQEITDGTPVKFELDDGTYNVRFYTRYLGENNETVTNAYYTIDYHIGVGDASVGTELNTGAGSTFNYHKTWSSRLAYLNDTTDPLDVYYVKDWNWTNNEQTKLAKATVKFDHIDRPDYIAPDVPVVLVGNAASTNESKTYVIVPGDPYGVQQAIQDCKPNVHNIVRCVYETEDYTEKGFKAEKYTPEWNTWSTTVGPGTYDNKNKKYTSRNFIFGRIVPTWRNDGQKELNFWRMKSTNSKMTGHKFLVKADVPAGTTDLESGATFGSYESGAKAQSMANYMTFCLDDEELATDIQNVESKEVVVENSRIYNLMGIEVKTPIRGQVYIINGRKTIKK